LLVDPYCALRVSRSCPHLRGLIDAIEAIEVVAADPGAVVIGLTNLDMYIAAQDWNYAYGLPLACSAAAFSAQRTSRIFVTSPTGMGWSAGKRIVPLPDR
jgi:hypothetical protein